MPEPLHTVRGLLRVAVASLPGDEARADADLLLAHAIGRPRAWLLAHDDAAVDAAGRARFDAALARRRAGEPVAMIVGRQGFWTFELAVGPDTLVPRPDTELLVERALDFLPRGRPADVLDLGTGSGAIALAIASERPEARVVAVDRSRGALAVAARNALDLGLQDRVRLLEGDWFRGLHGDRFDLVVSNPPYLAEDDPHLPALAHEPRGALVSGADGLDAIRHIVATAPSVLRPGGALLFEHGMTQGEAARGLLRAAGFDGVETWRDLGGRDRVSGGRRGRE
jgi:release factor glutamine methyltransferase